MPTSPRRWRSRASVRCRVSSIALVMAIALLAGASARGQRATDDPRAAAERSLAPAGEAQSVHDDGGVATEPPLPLAGEGGVGGTREGELEGLASPPAGREGSVPHEGGAAGREGRAFVRVEGDRFVVAGAPVRFVGANVAVMHGPRHRAALEATLDAVVADGLTVIRVWALGEQPADAPPWARDYAFRLGPDIWIEESFAHLDRVLAAARARGLRVIVVLANRWADYGGAPRYLAWAGRAVPLDPAGAPSLLAMPAFLEDPTARAAYRAHVERVVGRTSSLTGIAYRDDPAIFAWELINESDVPPRSRASLVAWTREMAALVHTLDPNHLVGAGHIGYVSQAQRQTWLAVQRLAEIDYADAHAYPTQYERVRSLPELDDYVDDAVQLAHHVVGKPFIWGELGFTTRRRMVRGAPRARWLERFLGRSEHDRVDGAMVWIYATASERPSEHGIDVDGPEVERTRDVRRVLSRFARRWARAPGAAHNPRLGPERGEAPLWRTRRTLRGEARAHRALPAADGLVWSIPPERFFVAEAEGAGRWDRGSIDHVYASGAGWLTYRVATPRGRARTDSFGRLILRLRASSELPGAGEGGTPDDASELRVLLDGHEMGRARAPVDDGRGAWLEVASSDPAVLGALARPGAHELRIEVPEGPLANGLCLYGAATGVAPLPEDAGELPGRIELRLER